MTTQFASNASGARRTITIDQIGAGRATAFAIPQIAKMFEPAGLTDASVVLYDPAPGKARARAREAAAVGVEARAEEMTGQAAIAAAGTTDRLLIISIDDATSCAECLLLAGEHDRPVVVTIFIQLPNGKLVALRAAFAAHDRDGKRALAAFLFTLGKIAGRSGSRRVWDQGAPPANVLLEPAMRAWFCEAVDRSLDMAAGVAPEGAPVEITFDGVETVPLFLRDSTAGFADRATLASELESQTVTPLRKGSPFAIAEVGTDSIQLVNGKYRALDRKVVIDTVHESIDVAGYEALDERREAADKRRRAAKAAAEAAEETRKAELAASVERAEKARLTRMNPPYVTD